jgi:hypothetical protein
MNEPNTQRGCAMDEDPALDELLGSLGHFEPTAGFEDRVMSRLVVSAPH